MPATSATSRRSPLDLLVDVAASAPRAPADARPRKTPAAPSARRRRARRESYTRFSPAEEAMLLGGVRTFGPGSWKKILARFPFHEKRTSVDLKDKYRNIMRARARRAAAEMNASPCSDAPVQVGVAGILPRPHRLPYPTAGYAVPVQAPAVWIPAAAPRADVAYWGYEHAGGGV